jgi:hypothetical protein
MPVTEARSPQGLDSKTLECPHSPLLGSQLPLGHHSDT